MTRHQRPAAAARGVGRIDMTVDRALLERLTFALTDAFTRSGHAVQVVTNEHMGVCSRRTGCTERCQEYRALLIEATDALGYGEPETEQLDLFAGVGG